MAITARGPPFPPAEPNRHGGGKKRAVGSPVEGVVFGPRRRSGRVATKSPADRTVMAKSAT